jgi:plasmid stability protein
MAQILVRNIEDDVKTRLQQRAALHGHSMEAEVRDILRDALKNEQTCGEGLGTRITARFRGLGLTKDEEITELRGFSLTSPFDE